LFFTKIFLIRKSAQWHIQERVRDAHTLWVACVMPLDVKKNIILSHVGFFPPFSLSSPGYYSLVLLVVSISTLIPIILISHFLSLSFCRNFICFQFYFWILIYQILYSPIWSSFFEFLIFYLGHFIKVLLVFNFIIQLKFLVLCFSIWSSLFWFLIFFFILL